MKVAIFGTGYVGLVTGTCLAEIGHEVTCVDVDAGKIKRLEEGVIPIFEPGLKPLVTTNVAAGRLHFTTAARQAIADAEIIMIAVGTPPDEDGSADLSHVLDVAQTIGRHLQGPAIILNKSTVPVGTAQLVRKAIGHELEQRGRALDFDVVSNPEFLKEGAAVSDCMHPDRIVIGADKPASVDVVRRLYGPFVRNHDRFVVMDVASAELTKYAANAMLATRISFMNEIANIAERVGADVEAVRQGIGSDPRIGWHFIYPGAGYGGSCFPKDVRALARTARTHGYRPELLTAVEAVNERQKDRMFEHIRGFYGDDGLAGRTVAVWGLAFKANTDDIRAASSRRLIEALWEAGVTVRAYDPQANQEMLRVYGEREDLVLCGSADEAVTGADALAVMTEWREFRSPDFARLRAALRDEVIFDGRNIYPPGDVEAAGIRYYGIGRGRSVQHPDQPDLPDA